jgi:Tfp pilus assembly protein PilO
VNAFVTRIRSSRRASATVVIGGVVLLAVATWMVVVSPKRADAAQLATQVTAAQNDLTTATRQAAEAKHFLAVQGAVLRALPHGTDEPGILDNLQAVGTRTGVVISAVTPNATASTTNSVALAVSVEGTYFQIRDFLHRLRTQVSVKKGGMVQAGGRLFDVTGVNISQPTAGSPTLTANLSVNAYAYDTGIAPVTPAAAPTDATATGGTTTGAPN